MNPPTAQPDALLIGGANGSGKTTFARQFLHEVYPHAEFLNSDEIQWETGAFAHPVAAGRELLRRLATLERTGHSFAVETTLSSLNYTGRLQRWAQRGYRTTVHFIEVPSAAFAMARVAAGGHHVADSDVRRRFERGIRLFQDSYKRRALQWYHWFSDDRGLRLVEKSE
ncbi:MAG: Zeta toxin family protein [Gammaproteobacteria bacterium]|nr:Zeta toxin family protein [Gammaproteobacteria bacterium]